MSEIIDNSRQRKAKLKTLILRLHKGESQESIRNELLESLSNIPYGEVVEVEQELIEEGLPQEEVLKLCDAHSAVLKGNVDLSASKKIPSGHPVDILIQENKELLKVTEEAAQLINNIQEKSDDSLQANLLQLTTLFNNLIDVDKHYQRKEYLLFPYLEKKGITGPPKVMWGKHDEIRELIKGSIEILKTPEITKDDIIASAEIILTPAITGVAEMVIKEEEILLPMALDNISDVEWWEIQKQSIEIGFCLYDPQIEWKPAGVSEEDINKIQKDGESIQLPSGSFSAEEILSILNTLPVDITFVDKDDKVKFYSQSKDRIFQRNRAIINRDVRHCHPPASTHIVEKILEDFKSGKQDRAPFWIKMDEKLIHIEYFALRNKDGEYIGTLEVSQDLTEFRKLGGERRILSYK